MSEQLALLEQPPALPKLTGRQAFTLQLVTDADPDGLHADEAGAAWCAQRGKHSIDDRCRFDGSNGRQVLEALKAKGLVRYRRGTQQLAGAWLLVGVAAERPTRVPYKNTFPEGY